MKQFFICLALVFLVVVSFAIGHYSQKELGRYQIYMNHTFEANYLLDTKTGKTWKLTQGMPNWREVSKPE